MKNVRAIAKITFRETVRDRILYGIVGFAVIYILLDLFFARISVGDFMMIKSFGLAGIYVFGLIGTIFLGASIVYKEIERRTLYFVLSKPVSYADIILGKFVGLLAAVAVTITLMTLLYLGVVWHEGGGIDYAGLYAVFFEVLEMGLFIALLIFLSSVVQPLTATLCAVMLLFVGHISTSVIENTRTMGAAAHQVAQAAYYVLPNLEKFDIRNLVVHAVVPPLPVALAVGAYAVCYAAVLLFFATMILRRREL